jgi:hypothetical protein
MRCVNRCDRRQQPRLTSWKRKNAPSLRRRIADRHVHEGALRRTLRRLSAYSQRRPALLAPCNTQMLHIDRCRPNLSIFRSVTTECRLAAYPPAPARQFCSLRRSLRIFPFWETTGGDGFDRDCRRRWQPSPETARAQRQKRNTASTSARQKPHAYAVPVLSDYGMSVSGGEFNRSPQRSNSLILLGA